VTQVDGNRIQVRAAITFPMGSRGCSVDVPIPVLGRIPILLSDGRTVAAPVPVDVPVTVPEGSELPKLPVFSGFIAPVSAPLPAPVPAPLFTGGIAGIIGSVRFSSASAPVPAPVPAPLFAGGNWYCQVLFVSAGLVYDV
jgi:hypothetical protein